jgi:hypothetical protein
MQDVMNFLAPRVQASGFLTGAPFKTVQLVFRFGEKTDLRVDYQRITEKDLGLPVAVQLELAPLRMASREAVRDALLTATIAVLDDIATKFNLRHVSTASLKE